MAELSMVVAEVGEGQYLVDNINDLGTRFKLITDSLTRRANDITEVGVLRNKVTTLEEELKVSRLNELEQSEIIASLRRELDAEKGLRKNADLQVEIKEAKKEIEDLEMTEDNLMIGEPTDSDASKEEIVSGSNDLTNTNENADVAESSDSTNPSGSARTRTYLYKCFYCANSFTDIEKRNAHEKIYHQVEEVTNEKDEEMPQNENPFYQPEPVANTNLCTTIAIISPFPFRFPRMSPDHSSNKQDMSKINGSNKAVSMNSPSTSTNVRKSNWSPSTNQEMNQMNLRSSVAASSSSHCLRSTVKTPQMKIQVNKASQRMAQMKASQRKTQIKGFQRKIQIKPSQSQRTTQIKTSRPLTKAKATQKKDKVTSLPIPLRDSYLCQFCKQKFSTKKGLYEHFPAFHPTERPFKCPDCLKTFKYITNMYFHKRTEHKAL